MSDIFPRLVSLLNYSPGVNATAAVHSIEAIKSEVIAKLTSLPLKTPLRAEVVAKLTDGSFIANVEEIPLRLSLPESIKVGDKLNLSLLQTHPRPLFSLDGKNPVVLVEPFLERKTQSPQSSTSSQKLIPNNETVSPRANLPEPHVANPSSKNMNSPSEVSNKLPEFSKIANQAYLSQAQTKFSTDIQLSETAQIIGTVLRDAEKNQAKLSIKSTLPLTDDLTAQLNPHSLAPRIAAQLHQQIEQSGLFYESHVVEWVNGQRSIEQLKQEPQAQLSLKLESSVLTDQTTEHHQQLSEIVHQQLDLADTSQLRWSGNLSPTIPMTMQIRCDENHQPERETDDKEAAENNSSPAWNSHLELDFPQLGKIRIELRLQDNASDIRCHVAKQEAMQALHDHAKDLMHEMHEKGLKLRSMKVINE